MTYEYLLAGLPELKAGAASPISIEKLEELLSEQLTDSHKKLWVLLQQDTSTTDEEIEKLYEKGLKASNAFVREWFRFNQDLNNVLVAQICRKHGFNVRKMIVGDGEVAEKLRENSSRNDFGLNEVMDNYQEILALAQIDNLMDREKAMDALRFEWLQEQTKFDFFSIEQVLAYYLEVKMLNRWQLLSMEEGERVFRNLVADMRKGVNLDA